MKIISLTLFGDPSSFEFGWYARGIYYNTRMARLLYPDWRPVVFATSKARYAYNGFIQAAHELGWFDLFQVNEAPRCEAMLHRMMPLFLPNVTHVMCRDADSVHTYREANCVYEWLRSGLPYHAINDNDAHAGLMGGLVAFRAEDFKRDTGYYDFDQMIKGQELKKHGSDQNFMNKYIHPKIKDGLFLHKIKGAGVQSKVTKTEVPKLGEVKTRLWVSDLISRYIGSAGVIDFELLRFFDTFDADKNIVDFETKFKDVCYWRR